MHGKDALMFRTVVESIIEEAWKIHEFCCLNDGSSFQAKRSEIESKLKSCSHSDGMAFIATLDLPKETVAEWIPNVELMPLKRKEASILTGYWRLWRPIFGSNLALPPC